MGVYTYCIIICRSGSTKVARYTQEYHLPICAEQELLGYIALHNSNRKTRLKTNRKKLNDLNDKISAESVARPSYKSLVPFLVTLLLQLSYKGEQFTWLVMVQWHTSAMNFASSHYRPNRQLWFAFISKGCPCFEGLQIRGFILLSLM